MPQLVCEDQRSDFRMSSLLSLCGKMMAINSASLGHHSGSAAELYGTLPCTQFAQAEGQKN